MIVSITCRHQTKTNISRKKIEQELLALSKYDSSITRVEAFFSKETHHKNADQLVTSHISIHIPNNHQVDIYEHQPTEMQAFDRARERAIKQIKRSALCERLSHTSLSSLVETTPGA